MKRVAYAELLDRLRRDERAAPGHHALLAGATIASRRASTERLKVRLTPEQRAFVRDAAAATHGGEVDESAIVAAALVLLERLEIPWSSLASGVFLSEAFRRTLLGGGDLGSGVGEEDSDPDP
jgi:hypothetical protein